MPFCTRSRVLKLLDTTPQCQLPNVHLRGGAMEVHGMSLMALGFIVGVVVAALLVYASQPAEERFD